MDKQSEELIKALDELCIKVPDVEVQDQSTEPMSKRLKYLDWKAQYSVGNIKWIPTDRTVLPFEIILELDPATGEGQEALELRATKAARLARAKNIQFKQFFSGNKSWHFHIMIEELAKHPAEDRKLIRQEYLKYYFTEIGPFDNNLIYDSHMIRLPGAINPKSGKLKTATDANIIPGLNNEIPSEVISSALKKKKEDKQFQEQSESEKHPGIKMANCMHYACNNKLPDGNRQQIYGKNLTACFDSEDHISDFVQAQDDPDITSEKIKGWFNTAQKRGEPIEFNCLEVKKVLNEQGLTNVCIDCKYYDRHFRDALDSEVVSFPYGNFKTKEPTYVESIEPFCDSIETSSKGGGIVNNHKYRFHLFNFGIGTSPRYLYVASRDALPGYGKLFMQYASKQTMARIMKYPPERPNLEKIIARKLKGDETTSDLLAILYRRQTEQNPLIYECTDGANLSELIKSSNEQFSEMIHDYITNGMIVDPIMKLAFLSDIMIPNPSLIEAKLFARYNSHDLIYTNSKVGKSSIATRVGMIREKVTSFALLGGGTADTIRHAELENTVLTMSIDELQEDSDKNQKGLLFSMLEQGASTTSVGKKDGRTIYSWSSLKFMGNPTSSIEFIKDKDALNGYNDVALDILDKFQNTLNKISNNYEALGSRLGFIIFLDNLKSISGRNLEPKKEKAVSALVDGIRKITRDNYTRLYLDSEIIDWLEKEYEPDFLKQIEAAKKEARLPILKEFLKSYADSNHHLRGKALKCACTDMISDIATGNINKKKLLMLCEDYYKNLKDICALSILRLADISSNEGVKKLMLIRYDSLQVYTKICILAAIKYCQEEGKQSVTSIELADEINEVCKRRNYTQGSLAIVKMILNNLGTINNRLFMLGVRIVPAEDQTISIYFDSVEQSYELLKEQIYKDTKVDLIVEEHI